MLLVNDELIRDLNMTEQSIKLEFAIWLYETDKLSLRKAAKIVSMNWLEFSKILSERNITTIKMDEAEFEAEVRTVKSLLK